MIAKDFAALEQILSPDLVYVHSTAVAESQKEYLAGVTKGLYEYESIASRQTHVRAHAPLALIDGICDMVVGSAEKPAMLIHLRFVLVFINAGGRWRLLHRHATRIPSEVSK
jgi:hypothetical protein